MSDEILVNVTPHETRVAIVENGILEEIHIERQHAKGVVGRIYKGIVSRVLPGMQAAFIDIGLEKTGFLHVSDVVAINEDEHAGTSSDLPSIQELLHAGQKILVQIVKDSIGSKGPRLTTHLSIASRYLVYMPDLPKIGVSQRIEEESERERLKEAITTVLPEERRRGYIVRTAAEGASEAAIRADTLFLSRVWNGISEKVRQTDAPNMVFSELPLMVRVLRDFMKPTFKLRVDDQQGYLSLCEFAESYVPEARMKIQYYTGDRPIFDLYDVERELQQALQAKVELKSGGSIVIEQTEAMTTIDVNTGGFVGSRNLEETIYKTNLEATRAIGHQLRLRNLGGIIMLDFIDMENKSHQEQVLSAMRTVLLKDHAKTVISDFSNLGLVQMTRKRTRESLEHVLTEVCPLCEGRGTIKTVMSVCFEIYREVLRESKAYPANGYLVLASQDVTDHLLEEESVSISDLEAQIGRSIKLQAEALYTQEQFDVVMI